MGILESCRDFYKFTMFQMAYSSPYLILNLLGTIFLIFVTIALFKAISLFLNNKFLPPIEAKISLKNMSILAPNSGYIHIDGIFIFSGFLFPALIPCLLLLYFLKVSIVWIYLTIAYRKIAKKEYEKLKARAKEKEKNVQNN